MVISTSQAQFGDQFIHVGPSGWIWVNFRDTPPFIFGSCVVAFFRSVRNHDGGAMRSPFLLAGRVTLQARPTFCFSRKQFTAFCKEMTLLPMKTCLHINGALGKEQLLGSKSRPVPTHMATPSCIATLHQLKWTTVRKQPIFCDTTVVSLWNDVWETTAEISYCWGTNTQFWVVLLIGRVPRENCNQKHYSDLGSDTWRRQYEISAVISSFPNVILQGNQ